MFLLIYQIFVEKGWLIIRFHLDLTLLIKSTKHIMVRLKDMRSDILKDYDVKIKNIISRCGTDIEISKINEETNLINDLSFSSVGIIQLIVEIESEFGIEIPDDRLNMEEISSYKLLKSIVQTELERKDEY